MNLFPVYSLQPITLTRARGSRVFDEKNEAYLDFYGGHAVISIGHQHPHWVKRIEEQLHQISFYSNSIRLPVQEILAQKLGEVSGKPDYSLFLCNSGAEANENAFKLASFTTGRKKVIAFTGAFHGRTSLAVSATDNPNLIAPVNQTDHVIFLPFNDEFALREYFKKQNAKSGECDIGSVIVEGIQGVGGIRVASNSFLKTIRELCDEHGAIFIADSVQCGYGRTGKFFAHDEASVNADIYTVAKGMGNGFPVAGVLIHPRFKAKVGMLGTTFGGNPLACAAALAVLETLESEKLIEKAREKGAYLFEKLLTVPGILNLRGRGLMVGFDLPEGKLDVRAKLLSEFRIFTGESKPNTVRLLPALTITHAEIDELISALDHLMRRNSDT